MAKQVAGAAKKTFNFGDLAAYSTGGGLPEGNYAIADTLVCMHAYKKNDGTQVGEERLGVMITFRPMEGGEDQQQFYSFGSKAHLSWQPDETGKKIEAVLGGPGTAPNNATNWSAFVQSLFASGMPQGILSDDMSVIDGTWVHMMNQPEPEGRKSYKQSATGEAAMAGAIEDKPRTVAVVTEILDGGEPWNGGGGLEFPAAATKANGKAVASPKAKVAAVAPKAALKAAPKAAPAPPPAEAEETQNDLEAAAKAGLSAVLSANEQGCPKLILKTSTFREVKAAYDEATASAVINTYFADDKALGALLEEVGFKLEKGAVKPAL
jgi:hypothetical protein